MISARRAMVANLRGFFDRELPGVVSWDETVMRAATPRPLLPNGRKDPEGKHLDLVTLDFRGYELTIEGPEQAPPLGRVSLLRGVKLLATGPIDESTWVQMGRIIKGKDHGNEE